ncbi:hypothetical protein KTR9_4963 (plasmid) [Gordonia sp. KTR9]|nr:hypothetical protein KTR9_4963 [Gordonia sp. KTR9]
MGGIIATLGKEIAELWCYMSDFTTISLMTAPIALSRTLIVGAVCGVGLFLSALTTPPASAAPTGCVAGSAIVAAASYCTGGAGEHRVQAACLTSSLAATLLTASGPWKEPGQLSVVTIGAPTNGGSCILPVFATTEAR